MPDPDTSDHGGSGTDSTDNHNRTDSTDTSYNFSRFDNSKIYLEDVIGGITGAVGDLVVGLATEGIGWFGMMTSIEVGATIASGREGIRQGLNQNH